MPDRGPGPDGRADPGPAAGHGGAGPAGRSRGDLVRAAARRRGGGPRPYGPWPVELSGVERLVVGDPFSGVIQVIVSVSRPGRGDASSTTARPRWSSPGSGPPASSCPGGTRSPTRAATAASITTLPATRSPARARRRLSPSSAAGCGSSPHAGRAAGASRSCATTTPGSRSRYPAAGGHGRRPIWSAPRWSRPAWCRPSATSPASSRWSSRTASTATSPTARRPTGSSTWIARTGRRGRAARPAAGARRPAGPDGPAGAQLPVHRACTRCRWCWPAPASRCRSARSGRAGTRRGSTCTGRRTSWTG